MTHRRVRPVLAAVVAVPLFLGACSPQQWGTAAEVGSTRISVQQLQDATQSVLGVSLEGRLAPEQQEAFRGQVQGEVLERLIQLELIALAARRNGITASDAEVSDAVAAMRRDPDLQRSLAENALPPTEVPRVARADVLLRKLAEKLQAQPNPGGANPMLQELARVAREAGVEVNPRYGRYDPAQFELQSMLSGGLARPWRGNAADTQVEQAPVTQ